MLLQDERPLWQANYKSMSAQQLIHELECIAKNPHRVAAPLERKAFIATELVLRDRKPAGPIIILMDSLIPESRQRLTQPAPCGRSRHAPKRDQGPAPGHRAR